VGSDSYSSDTWPRGAARAWVNRGSLWGAPGGARPRVRPQPLGAPSPQAVWEWSDAEKCGQLALRHSALGNSGNFGGFSPKSEVHPLPGIHALASAEVMAPGEQSIFHASAHTFLAAVLQTSAMQAACTGPQIGVEAEMAAHVASVVPGATHVLAVTEEHALPL
jgi:hypothetical protein